jgi:glyoxylase-like metal-dependent hydrolase (beta-lactamase superfamily II)
MPKHLPVERLQSGGVTIFRLPLEVFPQYFAYAHLLVYEGTLTLVDTGSGFGNSPSDLLNGFEAVRENFGIPARIEDIDKIIISHGHIDHFGGVRQVKDIAVKASVIAHELTRPVLANFDERLIVSSKNMAHFLLRAGVPDERRKILMEMYLLGKKSFAPTPVDRTVKDGDIVDGILKMIHVPGHEAGHVMIRVGDVLLTSDHILPHTSVALSPESLMPFTGVAHYIDSLKVAEKIDGIRLAAGGHEEQMQDYYSVVKSVLAQAEDKIAQVLECCAAPSSVYDIAQVIYGALDGYGELLRIGQVGARIEYLNQRGLVMIENLDEVEREENPIIKYRRV